MYPRLEAASLVLAIFRLASASSVSNCPGLVAPPHGAIVDAHFPRSATSYSGYTPGTTITFSCLGGRTLFGDPTRKCLGPGQWSGVPIACLGKP
jgi:hypothetical protein